MKNPMQKLAGTSGSTKNAIRQHQAIAQGVASVPDEKSTANLNQSSSKSKTGCVKLAGWSK